jgi:hypothetical protein
MTDAEDITEIATKMLATYGEHAAALMDKRADNHVRHRDIETADFWRRVADGVRRIDSWKEVQGRRRALH